MRDTYRLSERRFVAARTGFAFLIPLSPCFFQFTCSLLQGYAHAFLTRQRRLPGVAVTCQYGQ